MLERDKRLIFPLSCLLVTLVASLIQGFTLAGYVEASYTGNWDYFATHYGVEIPELCFGICAPKLPFVFGWIAIATFVAAFASLILIYWRPKSPEA